MAPPIPPRDTLHEDVAAIRTCLMGDEAAGRSGLVARVENCERILKNITNTKRFRFETVYAAIVGAVVATAASYFGGSH